MQITKMAAFFLGLSLMGNLSISQAEATQAPFAPRFNNLGHFHHKISTQSPLAQAFFDQGLVLFYGFEWGEAIRSFKAATLIDPHCGMCYWGLALSLGNLINAPLSGEEYKKAQMAIKKALSLKAHMTKKEQEYVNALYLRFAHAPIISHKVSGFSCHKSSTKEDKSSTEEMKAYSKAMQALSEKHPRDPEAKALYAFALFNEIDWAFWDAQGKINAMTPLLLKTLKSLLAKEPSHIGANHYYIHVIEQSPHPEKALENANKLRNLVPGSEHLVHMPAHIYFLTGRYHEGTEANLKAIKVFKDYNKACIQQGFKPEINYLYFHNFDFLRTTATMEGRQKLAMAAAHEMLGQPFQTWFANEPSLQWFLPIPSFVKARFGLWQELLAESAPKKKYQYAKGMWHYTQGMAFAHTNQIKEAEEALAKLKNIVAKGETDSTLGKQGHNTLRIAKEVLAAVLAHFQKNEQAVFKHLNLAAQIQKDMGYHEPPDWYFPLKEILGNAYLHWGQPKEAIAMYQQVLEVYPKNGWALYGLSQAFKKLKQDKAAMQSHQQYLQAWEHADISHPFVLLM